MKIILLKNYYAGVVSLENLINIEVGKNLMFI